jgi:hypothetical protein
LEGSATQGEAHWHEIVPAGFSPNINPLATKKPENRRAKIAHMPMVPGF